MRRAALVVSGGRGERFGSGQKKEFVVVNGASVLARALSPFLDNPAFQRIVLVLPEAVLATGRRELEKALGPSIMADPRLSFVQGGAARADSVRAGLESLASEAAASDGIDTVLVHDGARPFATPALVARVLELAERHGACIPVIPVVDTIKSLDPGGSILAHPARSRLGAAQTPQGFAFAPLLAAYRSLGERAAACTDDAEVFASAGGIVMTTEGELENKKITYPSDVGAGVAPRVGTGYDIHALVPSRRLLVGGVDVPHELGEDGWSDGDALLHAVGDAILGAACLGDIGTWFPPSRPEWKDADSRALLREIVRIAGEAGWAPSSVDCTVILERPKLGPHMGAIRANLASDLGIPVESVSCKAKTKEGFDATGEGRAIEAQAVAVLARR